MDRRRRAVVAEDDDAFLWAIRQVESGDRWDVVGRAGELGAYQFTPETWRRFTGAVFARAGRNVPASHFVAFLFRRALGAELRAAGRPESVWNLALRWRGDSVVAPGAGARERAQRVVNLYVDRVEGNE